MQVRTLELAASFYATIFIGFGILWCVNPQTALSFFELPYPQISSKSATEKGSADAKKTMDALSVAYGVRNTPWARRSMLQHSMVPGKPWGGLLLPRDAWRELMELYASLWLEGRNESLELCAGNGYAWGIDAWCFRLGSIIL